MLRGPSSVLYGDTSTAGLLNLISKRPQAEASNEIGVQFGSFNRKQVQMDSTGKLTKDGEWLYRFVGVFRDSNSQTDYVRDDRIVLAPSLTWRPTNNTSWTVLGTYQKDTTGSSTAFLPHEGTLFAGPNGLIPVRRFSSEPNYDRYQTETGAVTQPVRAQFWRWPENSSEHALRPCRGHLPSDVSGRLFAIPAIRIPFLDADRRTVSRYISNRETTKDSFTSDSNAELKFATGAVTHKALFGFDYRALKERASSGFGVDPTPFASPRARLSWRHRAGAVGRNPKCGRASLGFTRRTRCGSGRGSPSSACARISSPTTSRDRPPKTPRRPPAAPADVRTAVRPDALRHLRAVIHADLRRRRLLTRYARPSAARWWSSVSSTIRCRAPRSTARSTTPSKRTGWRPIPTIR